MDQETKNKIEELDKKINAIYESVEKNKKDYYVDRYHYNSSHCITSHRYDVRHSLFHRQLHGHNKYDGDLMLCRRMESDH